MPPHLFIHGLDLLTSSESIIMLKISGDWSLNGNGFVYYHLHWGLQPPTFKMHTIWYKFDLNKSIWNLYQSDLSIQCLQNHSSTYFKCFNMTQTVCSTLPARKSSCLQNRSHHVCTRVLLKWPLCNSSHCSFLVTTPMAHINRTCSFETDLSQSARATVVHKTHITVFTPLRTTLFQFTNGEILH